MIGRVLVLFAVLCVSSASACSCLPIDDYESHYQRYDVVLRLDMGAVLATSPTSKYYSAKVSEIYKANGTALTCGKQIVVKTAINSAACGVEFEQASYLVFGSISTKFRGMTVVETNLCAANQLLCAAMNDLKWKTVLDSHQGQCGCMSIMIYAPVCAKCDHLHVRTFGNSGTAACAGYSVLYDGECLPVDGMQCSKPEQSCQEQCAVMPKIGCEMGAPRCCANGQYVCPSGNPDDPSTWNYPCENGFCNSPTASDCQDKCKAATMMCLWGPTRCCADGRLSCASGNPSDQSTWTWPACDEVGGFCPEPKPL